MFIIILFIKFDKHDKSSLIINIKKFKLSRGFVVQKAYEISKVPYARPTRIAKILNFYNL